MPLQTGSVPNAPGASRAALCAGQQTMFWEMHDILFDWQTRYGNTAFSQNRLLAGVEQLGLITNAFTDCFNSAATSATLAAAQNEEVSTTPTIRVNGVTLDQGTAIPSTDAILHAIDEATPTDWGIEEAAADQAVAEDPEAEAEGEQQEPEPVKEVSDEEAEPVADAEDTGAGEAVESDASDDSDAADSADEAGGRRYHRSC